jgi:hypothetical protein
MRENGFEESGIGKEGLKMLGLGLWAEGWGRWWK